MSIWLDCLPSIPKYFKASTALDAFTEVDELTNMLSKSVFDAAKTHLLRDSKIGDSKIGDSKIGESKAHEENMTWPIREPETILELTQMVRMFCTYMRRYETYCELLLEYAQDAGCDEIVRAMGSDPISPIHDVVYRTFLISKISEHHLINDEVVVELQNIWETMELRMDDIFIYYTSVKGVYKM